MYIRTRQLRLLSGIKKTDGKHRAVKGHGALEEITDALSEVIDNL